MSSWSQTRRPVCAFFLRASAIAALAAACAWSLGAQTTLVNDGFEDGTTQGWFSFGPATVANTTADAHTGTHSLSVTNRGASYAGPGLDLTSRLTPGATYQISVWVKLQPNQSVSSLALNMTMKRTPSGGSAQYDGVATVTATDSSWVQLSGQYTFGGSVSNLTIYIQNANGSDPLESFYIDDFVVEETAAPPNPGSQDNSGITTGFEDGTTDGWTPRIGNEVLTVVSGIAHSGNYSLEVSNRTAPYDGAKISVANKMYNGSQYQVTVWAMLTPGESPTQLRVSLQVTLNGNTNYYTVVPNTTVSANGWTELTATYNMASNYDSAYLYVESNEPSGQSSYVSFYIDDFSLVYIPPVTIQANIPSVYQTLSYYFPVGAAVLPDDITGVHSQLLVMHFNDITSENDMKWDATEPSENNYSFTNADAEVAFAKANNMLVRGHNLCWDQQNPAWLFEDENGQPLQPGPATRQLLIQRLQNHINTLVSHFGNAIYVWDVVNEPIDPTQPDGLKHDNWYNLLGPDYIEIALQAARAAAPPGTKLFINQYSTTDPAYQAALYNLAARLIGEGVPLDGIGHEMHNNVQYPSPQAIAQAVNTFSQLGLDNEITELDMSVYTNSTSSYGSYSAITPELIAQQGYLYRDYFNEFRSLRGKISSVTFWGIGDDETWLDSFPISRPDAPLLFDTKLQAKPAYWGIVDPSQLPGASLTAHLTGKSGPSNARVWTIALSNPGPGTAYGAQISGFTLTQTYGAACTPVVTPPSGFPVNLGDLASGASASAGFTIDFSACATTARFTLNVPYSSTGGTNTGALIIGNQIR
jgi:endo-1,4-beta-xylanase